MERSYTASRSNFFAAIMGMKLMDVFVSIGP